MPIALAERRVLVLENPGLKGMYAITATLYAGFQWLPSLLACVLGLVAYLGLAWAASSSLAKESLKEPVNDPVRIGLFVAYAATGLGSAAVAFWLVRVAERCGKQASGNNSRQGSERSGSGAG